MSDTTFTWTSSGDNSTEWNLAANWAPDGGPPNSASAVALDGVSISSIISGGSVDTLAAMGVGGDGHVIVGGGSLGGTGPGTLIADAIGVISTNIGGGLVVQSGGTIISPVVELLSATPTTPAAPGAPATPPPPVIAGGGGVFDITNFENNGIIQADGGDYGIGPLLVEGGSISGTGSIEVDSNTFGITPSTTLELASATAQPIDIVTDPGRTDSVIFDNPASFTGALDFTFFATAMTEADLFFTGDVVTGGTFVPGTGTGPVGTLDVLTTGGAVLQAIPIVNVSGPLAFSPGTSPDELTVVPALPA